MTLPWFQCSNSAGRSRSWSNPWASRHPRRSPAPSRTRSRCEPAWRSARTATDRRGTRPCVDGQIVQQRRDEVEAVTRSTDHERRAGPARRVGDSAAGADVQEVQALVGELVVATPGVLPEGVAAVGDHVAAIQQRHEYLKVVVDDLAVRHPHQHDPRPVQTTGEVLERCDSGQAAVVTGLARLVVGVPADGLMSLLDGELAQAQAHPAQADDREPHAVLLSSRRGITPQETLVRHGTRLAPAAARLGDLRCRPGASPPGGLSQDVCRHNGRHPTHRRGHDPRSHAHRRLLARGQPRHSRVARGPVRQGPQHPRGPWRTRGSWSTRTHNCSTASRSTAPSASTAGAEKRSLVVAAVGRCCPGAAVARPGERADGWCLDIAGGDGIGCRGGDRAGAECGELGAGRSGRAHLKDRHA